MIQVTISDRLELPSVLQQSVAIRVEACAYMPSAIVLVLLFRVALVSGARGIQKWPLTRDHCVLANIFLPKQSDNGL